MYRGSCHCGGVSYQTPGPLRPVIACHCGQCRKQSGHYWAATQAANASLDIKDTGTLTWYRASERAARGFCNRCGASLFWREDGTDTTSIGAGTLDGPSGLATAKHIYVKDKGDYYQIEEGVPQA